MSRSAPSAAWLWTGRVALGLSVAVSAAYFICLLLIATLGRRDMGLSLFCAFASAAAAWCSVALAVADALLLAAAVVTGGPRGRLLAALLAALPPLAVLVVQHLAGR